MVSSGTGYVFAQNMMYRHTMTVYDSKTLKLVETIHGRDRRRAGSTSRATASTIQGAPVEAAVMPDGRFMYVSQYSMYGDGFVEGHDVCSPGGASDKSYVYRVSLADLEVDKVIKVGAVPKYLAVTPDQKYLLVSNWCSYSLSVIDVHTSKEVKSVSLGPYPRGIAVSPDSKTAYVAVMGTSDIAAVDLEDFSVSWIRGVGSGPRHLCMAGNGKYLYATLNNEGNVAKIDPGTRHGRRQGLHRLTAAQHGDRAGRQVAVRRQLRLEHDEPRPHQRHEGRRHAWAPTRCPSGSPTTPPTRSVWVCCYTGSIMVFKQV